MKKLSLILAAVAILSLLLSACSNGLKKSASTTDAEITTAVTTTGEPEATTDEPTSETIPEPIYIGMTEDELTKACEEWNDKVYGSVLKSWKYAFWLDENGYNAVAESEVVDGAWIVTSIDRYKQVIPTKEAFEAIDGASTSDITVQELVKRLGRPIGEDETSSSYYKLIFLDDTGCFKYTVAVGYGKIHIESRETRLSSNREMLLKAMAKKYSLQNVEFHRVLLDKDEEGNCKILVQGVHGENRASWCVSLYAPELYYAQYFNFRRSEILYNSEITEEYNEIFYAIRASVIYEIAYFIENDQYIIGVEIN